MRLPAPTRHLLGFIAAAAMAVGLAVFWNHTVDDAYITFRYAHNLATGLGVVWNPGEQPVEGYTNFSWMLLFAAADRLGLPLALLAKLLGIACLLLTAWLVFRHVRQKTDDEYSAWVALLALLLFPPSSVHAVSGLETPLYALLILATALTAEGQAQRQTAAGLWQVPLLTLAAGLTRPEGVLAGTAALACLLWRQTPALRRVTLRSTAVALVVPGAIYMAWRLAYFGWLLPNTFYVKVGYVWNGLFWALSALALLAPLLLVLLLMPGEAGTRPPRLIPRPLLTYSIVVAAALLPYAASRLLMDYALRFLWHVFPLLAVMLGLAVHAVRRALPELPPLRWAAVAALLLLALLRTGLTGLDQELLYGYHLENAHVALGKALAASPVDPDQRSLAIGDAGAVPYFSGWRTVDFLGLNDTAIAHGADPTSRMLQARPTLLILYSSDGREADTATYGLDGPRLLAGYRFLAAVLWRPRYYLNVYVRSDLPAAQQAALAAAVQPVAEGAARRDGGDGWLAWAAHLAER